MAEASGRPSAGYSRIDVVCNAGAGAAAAWLESSVSAVRTLRQTAGAVAATFVYPLDVIKTRFQVHGIPEVVHSGRGGSVIVTSLQQIVRAEGIRGQYRDLSPTIIAPLPNWAVYFSVYPLLKNLLHPPDSLAFDCDIMANRGFPSACPGDTDTEIDIGANMIVVAGAGAVTQQSALGG